MPGIPDCPCESRLPLPHPVAQMRELERTSDKAAALQLLEAMLS